MKKIIAILLSLTLAAGMSACQNQTASRLENSRSQTSQAQEASQPQSGSQQQTNQNEISSPMENSEPQADPGQPESSVPETPDESAAEENSTSKILVAYFSYGENASLPDGVDASASASIQIWGNSLTGNTGVVANRIAEVTGADLFSIRTVEQYPDSYDATIDQGRTEQSEDARPALAGLPENLDNYDVVFLGYPNWWGDMPMTLYSFLDQVDLTGKTVIPFVTSGGSGFSNTVRTIERLEPGAALQEGLHLRDSSATGAQEQLDHWLSSLGYTE